MVDTQSEPYGQHRQQNVYAMGMPADQRPAVPVRYEALEQTSVVDLDRSLLVSREKLQRLWREFLDRLFCEFCRIRRNYE